MTYDVAFYELETKVAAESAAVVLPVILGETGAHTVIDIGCGTGAWAAAATELGCIALGVDHDLPVEPVAGFYVDRDIRQGYSCQGWDLAICVEVAEHLPPESAEPLVAGLAHARAVLFSAATPGQPGVGHIHCQPHDYWHLLFKAHGLVPTFIGDRFGEPVADFYRRNLYLYRRP